MSEILITLLEILLFNEESSDYIRELLNIQHILQDISLRLL